MPFNTKEKEIIQFGVKEGKNRTEIERALANYRYDLTSPIPKEEVKKIDSQPITLSQAIDTGTKVTKGVLSSMFPVLAVGARPKETAKDLIETGSAIKKQYQNVVSNLGDVYANKQMSPADKILATGGSMFTLGSRSFGEAIIGAGKVLLTQEQEDAIAQGVGQAVGVGVEKAMENEQIRETVKTIAENWNNLPEDQQQRYKTIGGYLEGGADLISLRIAGNLKKALVDQFNKIPIKPANQSTLPPFGPVSPSTPQGGFGEIPTPSTPATGVSPVESAVRQTASDLASRVTTVQQHAERFVADQAEKALRIRQSTPAVADAIRVGVPDRVINYTAGADTPTLGVMKEMYDIKNNPLSDVRAERLAGEAAVSQYQMIDAQRAKIGAQIGEAIDNLPNANVDMRPAFNQLRAVLQENGATFDELGRLNLRGTQWTPEQRTFIQQAYDLTLERGYFPSAKQVHEADRLFSNLSRQLEIKRDINAPRISVGGKDEYLLTLMRDMYREPLDVLSPEMRNLNRQYAQYRNLVDDIEITLIRENKRLNMDVSLEDRAPSLMRRLESNAVSGTDVQAVLQQMRAVSTQLGYEGADPATLMRYSMELDKMFPDTIPSATLPGSIRTGLADIIQNVVRVGKPDIRDQQKALGDMLDELLKKGNVIDDVNDVIQPPTRTPSQTIDLSKPSGVTTRRTNTQGGFMNLSKISDDVRAFFRQNRWQQESARKLAGELDIETYQFLDDFTRAVAGEMDELDAPAIIAKGKALANNLDIPYKSNKDLAGKFGDVLEEFDFQQRSIREM